MYMLR